ncbi:MAG: type II secretion system protein, partial [Nitrospiria bacterium]
MRASGVRLVSETIRTARRGQEGFTLIELVITIVLVGIIAGVGALFLQQGVRAYISADARTDLTNQGRLAIERMAREIRTIRSRTNADIPGCCSATALSFYDVAGNRIDYAVAGGTVTRNLTPLASGEAVVLGFLYYRTDGTPA